MNDVNQWGPYLRAMLGIAAETAVIDIRPARPGDVQPILAMHERLSQNSLYLRYLMPAKPLQLADHIQTICSQPTHAGTALVATSETEVVGLGYYVVKPDQPDTVEPALLVEDRYQGQGIGGRLLRQLIAAARSRGVRYFDALAHSSNQPMLHLLQRSGQTLHRQHYGNEVALLLAV